MPLLQHVLYELWRNRRGPWLTLEAYEDSGGVQGALQRRAQKTYEALTPEQQAQWQQYRKDRKQHGCDHHGKGEPQGAGQS